MRTTLRLLACMILFADAGFAVAKQHIVAFAKWPSIKLPADSEPAAPVDLKSRSWYVDGRVKEITFGPAHDITDRAFVAQRMFRLNDSLPQDTGSTRWRWQRGGWLLVDRVTGKVQQLISPQFDPDNSIVNWFRDYAVEFLTTAKKCSAMILQLGRRKPLLKKALGDAMPEMPRLPFAAMATQPVRVTFEPEGDQKIIFAAKSRTVDLATEEESEGEE